jgi:hypothetical protein
MHRRPTRAELEAENVVLFEELVAIRDRLDSFLSEDDGIEDEEEPTGDPESDRPATERSP